MADACVIELVLSCADCANDFRLFLNSKSDGPCHDLTKKSIESSYIMREYNCVFLYLLV